MLSRITIFIALALTAAAPVMAAPGRSVTGRLIYPAEIGSPDLLGDVRLIAIVDDPEITYPDEYVMWTPEQRHGWYLEYLKTDAGKAYKAALDQAAARKRAYVLAVEKDGAFRADDIIPGQYKLIAQARGRDGSHYLVTTAADISIPEGAENETVELGAEKLVATKSLEPGDAAPDFVVRTFDGHELRLSDYKGKVVLINFWASWCGPCMAEIPALKATENAFAKDSRFVMINLCLDESPNRAMHVVEKNQLNWAQGFLGDWYKSSVREAWGVQKIPATFLVSAEQKIISKNLDGPEIKAAVEAALAK